HAVDTFANVHDLTHTAVGSHRCQRVGFVSIHRSHLLRREEIDTFFGRVDERFVEIFIEADQDPMRLGLDSRPFELHVLADDWMHHELTEGALKPREVHFTVALTAVCIPNPNEASLEENRNEDSRSL